MTFHLPAFIDKIQQADSIDEERVQIQNRMLTTMRLILDSTQATPELLSQVTAQDIEWAFDLMLYWPDWEATLEPEDYNHEGVQHVQIRDIVKGLSQKKSIKRKVNFI